MYIKKITTYKLGEHEQSTDGGETTTVGGETSRGRNILVAKRLGGETSWWRNVQGAKRPGGETSCEGAKRPGGETSINPQSCKMRCIRLSRSISAAAASTTVTAY